MLFNSVYFLLIFVPVTLIAAGLVRRFLEIYALTITIACASLYFYVSSAPQHAHIFLATVFVNFACYKLMERYRNLSFKICVVTIISSLITLSYFKYQTLFFEIFKCFPAHEPTKIPPGISFYIFTQIAFIVDVYKSKVKLWKYSFSEYILFVSYFPHLIAGPIIHHGATMPQFRAPRFCRFDRSDMEAGLFFLTLGLGKKVIIADSLAPFADAAFSATDAGFTLSFWEAWFGLLAYSLQIYFDFSGYSDMAVGLSRILGVDLPINFNSPYKSRSIVEFWRRWHISLSDFLKNYLYIPLGGNRFGAVRRHLNIFVTMAIGGLWHGGTLNFLLWGVAHGVLIVTSHLWQNKLGNPFNSPRYLSIGLTFVLVSLCWVLFRSSSYDAAMSFFVSLLAPQGIPVPESLLPMLSPYRLLLPMVDWHPGGMFTNELNMHVPTWVATVLGALLLVFWARNSQEIVSYACVLVGRRRLAALAIFGLSFGLILLSLSRPSAFLYFQF